MLAECDTVFAAIQLEYPLFAVSPPLRRVVIFVPFAHTTYSGTLAHGYG